MNDFIKIIRWLFSIPLLLILFIAIMAGISAVSISQTITKPSNLKSWLRDGKVYNKIPALVPQILISQSGGSGAGQMPLDENDLTQVSTAVLETSWIQANAEKVIDGGYLFLEGQTKIPVFKIDISDRKDVLVDEISSKLNKQMGPGMTQQLEKEIEKNELLSQGTIDSTKLIKIDQTEVDKIQTAYGHLQKLPLYAVAAFLLISLLLFLTVPQMPSKVRVIGLVWALAGFIMAAASPFAQNILQPIYVSQIQKARINNPDLILELMTQPVNLAIEDIASRILIYGVTLTVLGIILIITSCKLSKKKKTSSASN